MSVNSYKNTDLEDLTLCDAETKTTTISVPCKRNEANDNLWFVIPGDEVSNKYIVSRFVYNCDEAPLSRTFRLRVHSKGCAVSVNLKHLV